MKIFLVNGLMNYEGSTVLGAYRSKALAESALEAYKVKAAADTANRTYDHFEFDDYSITECVLDANAKA